MIVQLGLAFLGLFRPKESWGAGAQKAAGISILVILGIIVLGVGKCSYDSHVISQHEQQVQIDAAKAENAADKNLASEQAKFGQDQKRLEDAATEAARSDPSGAAKQVGPVTRSYYDNLPEKRR